MSEIDRSKPLAIILLNLGGPDTIAAIRPFLLNLFSDRTIIKLPVQPLLARLISRTRARKVAARYEAIGGGSPILRLTEEQAELLETSLKLKGVSCRVYVGMSYWHPFISDAVAGAAADGYEQVLGFSLFPHFSKATSGACLDQLARAVAKVGKDIKLSVIDEWCDNQAYIKALSEQVRIGLTKFAGADRENLVVIFSAHSLPQEFVDQGDPYPDHLKKTIDAVVAEIGPLDWRLTFQSRSGPVKWMEPQTDATIVELGRGGTANILIVPISFVSDHIETLYEIDIMYKELALINGVRKFERSPSLNSTPAFIEALTEIALSAAS